MYSLIDTIIAHKVTSIALAAVLSLFFVFIYVTLLHCLASRFLAEDARRGSSSVLVVPHSMGVGLFILRSSLTMDNTQEINDPAPSVRGLKPCVISSIPQFVFGQDEEEGVDHGLECVICLSLFQNGEKGKRLDCCHAFHVECIDMWLYSHTTCPVCRAPAVKVSSVRDEVVGSISNNSGLSEQNFGTCFQTTTTSGETSLSDEEVPTGRLEIVIEFPNLEDGSNETC